MASARKLVVRPLPLPVEVVVAIGLFAGSLAWKLDCLRRLTASPLAGVMSADAELYWTWSREIATGHWMGKNPFFLGPLYPYLLAFIRLIGGDRLVVPLAFQCVLGASAVVLVYAAALRLSGRRFALLSGVAAAGYGMTTFLDLSILSESALLVLELGFLVLQLQVAHRGGGWRSSSGSGLLIGLMSLARPSASLLLLTHFIAVRARSRAGQAVRRATVCAACATAVCVPVLIRHLALGHGAILTTYSFGYNLYVGNGPLATGTYDNHMDDSAPAGVVGATVEGGVAGDGRAFLERTTGLALTPLTSSAWFATRAAESLLREPVRALRLVLFKAALSLNRVEATQLASMRVHEHFAGRTGLPGVGEFAVLGTLGLLGLFLVHRSAGGAVLIAQAVALWLPMVVFFVTDRYRVHLAVALLVAVGPAVQGLVVAIGRAAKGFTDAWWALIVLGVAAILVWLPLVPYEHVQIEFDVQRQVGEAWVRKGDLALALRELEKCVSPAVLRSLPLERSSAARGDVADVLETLGRIHLARDEYAESVRTLQQALGLRPERRGVRADYMIALAMNGAAEIAISEADTLGMGRVALANDIVRIAAAAVSRAEWPRAERALQAAILVDSTSEVANVVLLRILRSQRRITEARELVAHFKRRDVPAAVIERETVGL